jgi:hypothetical protein
MRRRFLALVFPIAALTGPAYAQTAVADKAPLLIGTWSCETAARSQSTMIYSRNPDGSIAMKNNFTTVYGQTGEFDELYRFDSAAKVWNWSATMPGDHGFAQSGTAQPWTADAWVFTGTMSRRTQSGAQRSAPVRMTYLLSQSGTFARKFEIQANGAWTTLSSGTCTKS